MVGLGAMNTDLPVGTVGRICRVSVHTVHRWIHDGLLIAYVIPGGRHRRIVPADLRAFLHANKLPQDCLDRLEELERGA